MDRAKGTLSPSLLEELKCLMGQGVKIEDRRPSASSSSDEEDFERASRYRFLFHNEPLCRRPAMTSFFVSNSTK